MIKRFVNCFLLLFCFTLSCCGGQPVTKPFEIEEAKRLSNDGLQAFSNAEWHRAHWLFNRALLIYQGIDNQQGVLHSRINLAEVALSENNYAETVKQLDLAAIIAKNKPLENGQARISILYALTALQQKQIIQAENYLQTLLPRFDGPTPITVPDVIQMNAIAIRTKIAFLQNKGELLWTNRFANSLEMSTAFTPDLNYRLLRFQSQLLQRQKRYVEAESNLYHALIGYKTTANRSGIAATLLELGQLYMIQERWLEARDHLDRSAAVSRYLNDLGKVIQVTEKLKQVAAEQDNLVRMNEVNQRLIDLKQEQAKQ